MGSCSFLRKLPIKDSLPVHTGLQPHAEVTTTGLRQPCDQRRASVVALLPTCGATSKTRVTKAASKQSKAAESCSSAVDDLIPLLQCDTFMFFITSKNV
uniref:Uncharacterized protein n=1 Tax=Heterorhabditis bacteriophora TaxID=37862 RepID=A0A1I7XAH1_HETBA